MYTESTVEFLFVQDILFTHIQMRNKAQRQIFYSQDMNVLMKRNIFS